MMHRMASGSRDSHGVLMANFPRELQVQRWPKTKAVPRFRSPEDCAVIRRYVENIFNQSPHRFEDEDADGVVIPG